MDPVTRSPARPLMLLAVLAALALPFLASRVAAAGVPPQSTPVTATPVTATPVTATPVTLVAAASAASRPVSALAAARVPAAQLATVTGGTCTNCSSGGGGGGGGDGSSGAPIPVGSPYWVTYRVILDTSYYSPASLASRINNWSSLTINGIFSYTYKVVRDVQFTGGYASFVSASIGGEVSLSTTASVSYPVPPMSYGKLYEKYYTARQTFYGHQYQDYNDGTRTIVDSDSGPYVSTSTVLGYVTGPL